MNINVSKTGAENFLDLILESNPAGASRINIGTVDLSAPVAYAGTNGRNTEVTLTMKANQSAEGSQTFHYIRLGVGAAIASPTKSFQYGDTTTWAQFKQMIADGLGVRAADITLGNLSDVKGQAVTWDEQSQTVLIGGTPYTHVADAYGFDAPDGPNLNVIAKNGSFLYIGVTGIDADWDKRNLDLLIPTKLEGFHHEEPVAVYRARDDNWPGESTNAVVNDDNELTSKSATWADLPATWAEWNRWDEPKLNNITYVTGAIPLTGEAWLMIGGLYEGQAEISIQTSLDGVGWSAEQPHDQSTIITTPYVRVKIAVQGENRASVRRLVISVYAA